MHRIEQLEGDLPHGDFNLMVSQLNQLSEEFRSVPHPELREVLQQKTDPENANSALFAARNIISGNIAGFAGVRIEDLPVRVAHISELVVDGRARGQKLGSRLLSHAVEWAREREVELVQMDLPPRNDAAKHLLKVMGFSVDYHRLGIHLPLTQRAHALTSL